MKFNFFVSYPANLFNLVDNLSQWDVHTDSSYLEEWMGKFGLTRGDKELLGDYASLRRKYGWCILDNYLILAKNIEEAKRNTFRNMESEDFTNLWKIYDHFRENFDVLWQENKNFLLEVKNKLKGFSQRKELHKSLEDAENFFSSYVPYISCHLLFKLGKVPQGGVNLKGFNITLECPKGETAKELFGHILHEVIHKLENSRIKFYLKRKVENYELLHESILDSLAPRGYLVHKYLDNSKGKPSARLEKRIEFLKNQKESERRGIYTWRTKIALKLLNLTQEYIESKKNVGGGYLEKAIEKFNEVYPKKIYLS